MALKGLRIENHTNIDFFMDEVGNRGGVVSVSTAGSGISMDQAAALATYAAAASGSKPLGFLLNDVVNLDLTRQHLNQHKDEVQKGGKVTILRQGWVVTDQIASGITLTGGDKAYLAAGGRVTNVFVNDAATPFVGQFLSKPDEDGYCKVEVNLP